MFSSILILLPFVIGVFSSNNWNIPCINGQCSYDLPSTDGPSGTLKIDAITDITPAADWQILGCNQTALSQSIRLVCMNNDPTSLVTRASVEPMPLRSVSKSWIPDDQSIPSSIKARLDRRNDNTPVVKALAIDTNFDAVDWSKTGKVNFAIHAANVPGVATDIQIPGSRRAHVPRRSFLRGLNSRFGGDKTFHIAPVTLSKSANLFNTSVECGPTSASLSVDIDANATAQPVLTLLAEGTFFPPRLSNFQVVAGLTAQVSGSVTVSAELTGHVDSGAIPLLNIGIPGFDFPGVFTVGPSLQLNAQFVGDVDLVMDLSAGINFAVDNAQLVFPPNSTAPDSNAFSIGDTPLSLSATPGVQATGTLTAHLIPSLNLGVSVLGGKGEANIFLALDTSAALVLNLDASATITQPVGENSTQPISTDPTSISLLPTETQSTGADSVIIPLLPSATPSDGTDSTITPLVTDSLRSSDASATATIDASSSVQTDTDTIPLLQRDDATVSESFGGCVQVIGGINVNAGAEGDFFGKSSVHPSPSGITQLMQLPRATRRGRQRLAVQQELPGLQGGFTRVMSLSRMELTGVCYMQKCFGDGADAAPPPTKRSMRRLSARDRQRRSPFSCSSPDLAAPESVADEDGVVFEVCVAFNYLVIPEIESLHISEA
ncbi:hypothetical protein B0H14DRAFT_3142913 [Mycena olivaceomarginata]|nr:hypothetical protein B0H14DRAFT_3142913 [Mycena olivaceomarginata]